MNYNYNYNNYILSMYKMSNNNERSELVTHL